MKHEAKDKGKKRTRRELLLLIGEAVSLYALEERRPAQGATSPTTPRNKLVQMARTA